MKMLKLSNDLLAIEAGISRLEHFKLDLLLLNDGDPVLDDTQLTKLNEYGDKIWRLKIMLKEKTEILNKMKSEYYRDIKREYRLLRLQI